MILYRYMCSYEFKRFLRGDVLESNTQHGESHKTTSKGFCFLGENTTFMTAKGEATFNASECLDFLTGIVSEDIIACFEVPDELVTEAKGTYADPYTSGDELIEITEYNVQQYSKDTCKLIKMAVPTYNSGYHFVWFSAIEE